MSDVMVIHSINRVQKKSWDRLAGGRGICSYGWLKTLESAMRPLCEPMYILYEDEAGYTGAAVCYIQRPIDLIGNLDYVILGRLNRPAHRLGISTLPALICGPFLSYGTHILVRKDLEVFMQRRVEMELLDRIEKEGERRKLPIAYIGVTEDDGALCRMLSQRGFIQALDVPLNYMDIRWASFDAYKKHLKAISKNISKSISREINRNRKAGVVIEPCDTPEIIEDRLFDILRDQFFRHNRLSFMFDKSFFRNLKKNTGNHSVLYVAKKDDEIAGVSVLLRRENTGYILFIGVDREKCRNDFTYFNIGYYRPIEDAINTGIKRLYFGPGMYELKARRGCRFESVSTWYKPATNLQWICATAWFPILSAWNRNKIPDRFKKRRAMKQFP